MEQSKDRTNKEKIGMLAGLLIPFVVIVIYYLFTGHEDFSFVLKQIFMGSSYTRIFGLCIVPNFAIFFIFRYQKSTKQLKVSPLPLLFIY